MSKKHFLVPIAAVLAFGLMSVFATSAIASPSLGVCGGCHSLNSSVVVKATQTANNGSTATYSISVKGPGAANGWAVYAGSARQAYGSGGSGTVSVAVGKTYTVYGGNLGSSKLYNTTSISPVAPPSGGTTGTPNATGTPAPTPDPAATATTSYRVHFNLHHHRYLRLKAVLTSKATGKRYYAGINRKGNATFKSVPVGAYRLSTTGNRHYKFKARTVRIGVHEEEDDD
jgi:hypothetical protein